MNHKARNEQNRQLRCLQNPFHIPHHITTEPYTLYSVIFPRVKTIKHYLTGKLVYIQVPRRSSAQEEVVTYTLIDDDDDEYYVMIDQAM